WLDAGPIVRVARYRFGRRWDRVWHPAGAFRAEDVARAVALVEEKERGLLWETPNRTSALEPATPPPLPRRPARAVA
ncbi:MAG TPA: hypothetical protein RMG45_12650, partial [Polyangiaceae bacterium LLY-WYZ-15_(1-7)]|nr:hypothetical protein [Polyangiaceae bacterium LLY-WYZ-15_(1-7)]